jgi:hypothetical protein
MTAFGFLGMCFGFCGCILFAGTDRIITRGEKLFGAVFWLSVPFFLAGIGIKLWEAMP